MHKLFRCELPQTGIAFVVMPHGEHVLPDGTAFDFDALYREVSVPTLRECGMTAERSEQLFDSTGAVDALWSGVQHAEVVIVDCTTRTSESAMVLGLAMALGKRLVILAQRTEDIPPDLSDPTRVVVYDPAGLGLATLIHELKTRVRQIREEVVTENNFVPLESAAARPGRGTVVLVHKDRVTIETVEDGRTRLRELDNADVEYTRLVSNMSRLFHVGDDVEGAVTTGVDGVERFTMLADQINPWPRIASAFPSGHVYTGRVKNVREGVGAFISVAYDINGFLPYADARQANLTRDMAVTVEVISVSIAARKITLRLRSGPPGALRPVEESALPHTGAQLFGRVIQAVPEQEHRGGGFLLLRLSGYERGPLAMLHCTRMTPPLRAQLNGGVAILDQLIPVEVINTDPERHRIQLTHRHHETVAAESSAA